MESDHFDGRDGTGGREYIERSTTNYKIAEKRVKVHSVAVMGRTYSNSRAERWKLKLEQERVQWVSKLREGESLGSDNAMKGDEQK